MCGLLGLQPCKGLGCSWAEGVSAERLLARRNKCGCVHLGVGVSGP